MPEGYMDTAEAAEVMGISVNALYERIWAGTVKAERVGRRVWLVPTSEVERFKGLGKLKSGPKVGSKRTPRA